MMSLPRWRSKTAGLLSFAALVVSVTCVACASGPRVVSNVPRDDAQGVDLGTVMDGAKVRIVVLGDFGDNKKRPRGESSPCSTSQSDGCQCHWHQERVANAIFERHQSEAFDAGLTVGDNFYESGVRSTTDKHWRCSWKRFYNRLGVVFYPTFGNHDYRGNERAQIDYSELDETWNMPSRYYTFRAGPVRFFALDTVKLDRQQVEWLKKALAEPTDAKWKILYGHHPVYSCSHHKDTRQLKELLPELKLKENGVVAYLGGHDHDLQHIRVDGIDFFVSGGGGRKQGKILGIGRAGPAAKRCSDPVKQQEGFEFGSKTWGFLTVEADEQGIQYRFIGQNGEVLWAPAPSP